MERKFGFYGKNETMKVYVREIWHVTSLLYGKKFVIFEQTKVTAILHIEL